ncbi:DNA methylase [Mycobacterium phage Rando14]|uniref:DNA (cytosine-5-)-methyltransferase n=1 Tax=Mycobacterium phage Rando14 TaxID=2301556 RepID=A0A385D3X8_9CAUD|nr:DNA methyltransferase [Mycobacterium phage Rando14]AXQ53093.1 DNA methylase [Mycobacterium phage Rando14]
MTLTVTDLFSGAGGSSEGLRQAGCHITIAANHNPTAVSTHQLNHPETEHRCADLSETDWRTFPATDVAWVSPSCVWHARAGGRKRPPADVERMRADAGAIDRATAFAVVEAAEVHRYPIIFVENVPEFTDWTLFNWWCDGLRALGYLLEMMVLNAADFGHAQHRKRWFMAATQPGITLDLTPPDVAPVYAADILDDHPGKPVTRKLYVSPQIDAITDTNVPHLVTYRRNAKPRRADRSVLATVTAGGNHHGVALVDEHGQQWHRMLNNRECARAQGFPDTYEFIGTAADVKRQIGNAVPVGVARWLGERATAALDAKAAA